MDDETTGNFKQNRLQNMYFLKLDNVSYTIDSRLTVVHYGTMLHTVQWLR